MSLTRRFRETRTPKTTLNSEHPKGSCEHDHPGSRGGVRLRRAVFAGSSGVTEFSPYPLDFEFEDPIASFVRRLPVERVSRPVSEVECLGGEGGKPQSHHRARRVVPAPFDPRQFGGAAIPFQGSFQGATFRNRTAPRHRDRSKMLPPEALTKTPLPFGLG